jgi:hypothetical protein
LHALGVFSLAHPLCAEAPRATKSATRSRSKGRLVEVRAITRPQCQLGQVSRGDIEVFSSIRPRTLAGCC